MKRHREAARRDRSYVLSAKRENSPVLVVDPDAELRPGELVYSPALHRMYRLRRGERTEETIRAGDLTRGKYRVEHISAVADTCGGQPVDVKAFKKTLPFWT
jgi:hypothetical protein